MPSHSHTQGENIPGTRTDTATYRAYCNYGHTVISGKTDNTVKAEVTSEYNTWRPNTSSSGSTSAHTHTVSETTHTHTISSAEGSNLPPWYSLVYCVKLVS